MHGKIAQFIRMLVIARILPAHSAEIDSSVSDICAVLYAQRKIEHAVQPTLVSAQSCATMILKFSV